MTIARPRRVQLEALLHNIWKCSKILIKVLNHLEKFYKKKCNVVFNLDLIKQLSKCRSYTKNKKYDLEREVLTENVHLHLDT